MTLVPADNHFALMAALFVIAGLGFLGEKTKIGSQLTGAVIAILGAIAAANLNIIPQSEDLKISLEEFTEGWSKMQFIIR